MARKGNLCAVQVFAGWDNPFALTILMEITHNGSELAQRIAFKGIANNWPNESRTELYKMLHNSKPELVHIAIKGLENTGDSTVVDSLVTFLGNSDISLCESAADAIGELGPGKQAPAILKTILTTEDYNTAITLANSLMDHKWKDKSAIKPLAERLKIVKGELCFPLVKLLRHLSGDAFGPEDYSEWYSKQEEWNKKWIEWAAKQSN
jgi:HEAT repeat protein